MYICKKCGEEAVPNNYIAGYYCYNCRNLGFNEVCSAKEIYKEWLECKSLCTMTSKETGETKDSETLINQCEEGDELKTTDFKVGDRVRIVVGGEFMGEGIITNINDLREPSMKYAVDADFYKKDWIFAGEYNLETIKN